MTKNAPRFRFGRYEEPRERRYPTTGEERLRIELEDAASSSWWARILYTLGSQYGRTQLRFVGKTEDGRRRYVSDTFPGPPLGPTPLDEQSAPGMEASLRGVCQQIAGDGWNEARGQSTVGHYLTPRKRRLTEGPAPEDRPQTRTWNTVFRRRSLYWWM
jgi:hypothetical protein